MLTTTTGRPVLRPQDVDELLVRPVLSESVAAQVARVVHTESKEFRLPIVVKDPAAAWVAEGAEIPVDDATLVEAIVTPSKVAGLTIITRELAEDSSPEAASVVGQGLARDIARKIDAAFFGAMAAPAQPGLAALVGVSKVAAGAAFSSLDPFADAAAAVEGEGASVGAWIANPADALALAKVKQTSGSGVPLLAADPTQPARRILEGRPLLVSSAVQAGVIWGLPADRVVLVLRADSRIDVDESVYFQSDRLAVRGTCRVGFGYPHPAAVARIAVTGAPAAAS